MSSDPVAAFDPRPGLAAIRAELHRAIERVLASGQLILGPEVERFEADFAASLDEGVHAVGVSSGTAALEVALRALGVGPGDEVVTVANAAVPTVAAIRAVGAAPVLCDVCDETALLDLDRVEAVVGPRTRVVLPVHLYGNPVDVEALRARLAGRDVRIVEDCAQAQGALLRGRPVGTFGDVAAFSFYPTKGLGAVGDAGACATRDPELAAAMRSLRSYGLEGGEARREGINARLDELQAAVLNVKLPRLAQDLARRRALAALYDAQLPAAARRLVCAPEVVHARHLYVVRVVARARVRELLDRAGIGTGVHYPLPVHRMRAYAFLGLGEGDLPVSERLAREVLSLPLYPELAQAAVLRVCAAVADALG
jgi:dTDP-4-amino-4,6-dideoxygalactose transaminase